MQEDSPSSSPELEYVSSRSPERESEGTSNKEETQLSVSCNDTTADDVNSPTVATNSNTSSETASLPESTAEDHHMMLVNLARQLEFYFSPSNLARDFYLQTLQSLNDGHVPVSILANFAKVQALCERDEEYRIQQVIKAASEYTSLLKVVPISTVTNKRMEEYDSAVNSIWAVGPSSTETKTTIAPPMSPKSPIQNVIILRDVHEGVTEEDVKRLFCDSHPSLVDVRLDVANCWFVTLDASSRDEMMNVMMELRSRTLHGEPVKARLKGASLLSLNTPPSIAAPIFIPLSLQEIPAPPESSPSRTNNNTRQQQPKKLQPHNSKNGSNNNNNNKNQAARGSRTRQKHSKDNNMSSSPSSSKQQPKEKSLSSSKKITANAPPKLLEQHFPALAAPSSHDDATKIVDSVNVVAGTTKKPSDAASTTTTTSSTTSSTTNTTPGGYAAALLKAAPTKTTTKATEGSSAFRTSKTTTSATTKTVENNRRKKNSSQVKTSVDAETREPQPKENVPVVPLTWGSGRSFAEVLKQKEEATTS